METVRVGMREFRDKLATYLLESDAPVAITRHGDTFQPAANEPMPSVRRSRKPAPGGARS
jgi:hypothetical protein